MNEEFETISQMSDADLAAFAQEQRREALRGNRNAHGWAHEAEKELRRRGGYVTQSIALDGPLTLVPLTNGPKPWWRFWV